MVRIKDIAERANVSTATVSYVLNGSGNISGKTREKILKIIEEMNYVPNHIAKSLKMKKTGTIGVIVEDMTSFNSSEIIDGINEYADKNGLSILLTNMRVVKLVGNNYLNTELCRELAPKAVNELLNKQVDGLIYIGCHPRDVSGLIPDGRRPIVYTYCYTSDNKDYSVNYDDELAAYEATRYLFGMGHRKIAVISGAIDSDSSRKRFNGYYRAVMDHQMVFNPALIKTGDWEYQSGYELMKDLIAGDERPSAILAMNDLMASGAIEACQESGLSVPSDISVMGFDDREFSAYIRPKLTTMALPLHDMGRKSMETLAQIINNDASPELPETLKCKLVERDSVSNPGEQTE
jgi:LacI family transcriptional regulator